MLQKRQPLTSDQVYRIKPVRLSDQARTLLTLGKRVEGQSFEGFRNLQRTRSQIINASKSVKQVHVPAFGTQAITRKNASVQRIQVVQLPNGKQKFIKHRFDFKGQSR